MHSKQNNTHIQTHGFLVGKKRPKASAVFPKATCQTFALARDKGKPGNFLLLLLPWCCFFSPCKKVDLAACENFVRRDCFLLLLRGDVVKNWEFWTRPRTYGSSFVGFFPAEWFGRQPLARRGEGVVDYFLVTGSCLRLILEREINAAYNVANGLDGSANWLHKYVVCGFIQMLILEFTMNCSR